VSEQAAATRIALEKGHWQNGPTMVFIRTSKKQKGDPE
jgi:hypothetical protein